MSPSRQLKDQGDPGSPNSVTVGGGTASADKLNDIYQTLGSLQRSTTYLEGFADDTKRELRIISEKISLAQGSFNTAKYFLGAICIALWAMIAMWVKHRLGW